jgi:citrate lyase subunit beta/citryl-CoA lyase
VNANHCRIINNILTPSIAELESATEMVAAFERARTSGEGQVIHNGTKVEVPTYLNAKQVIQRHEALSSFKR